MTLLSWPGDPRLGHLEEKCQKTRHHPARQPFGAAHVRNRGPIQSVHGILHATAPSAASELRSALALAARNEASIGKTGLAIRLTAPNAPPILAHVLPLAGSDFRTQLEPAAVAAVFIGAPPDEQDGADTVAAAFASVRRRP